MRVVRLIVAVVCACALALVTTQAFALDPSKAIAQYLARTWRDSDGLPQNSVSAILQSRDGYLWLGTEEGLVRFDGVRFSVYDSRVEPALRVSKITRIFEDHGGRLWLGTFGGGVTRWSDGAFHSEEGIAKDATISGITDGAPADTVYVATSGGELFRESDGKLVKIDTPPLGRVRALTHDRSGALWMATEGDGLVRYAADRDELRRYTTKDGLGSDFLENVYVDRQGVVWGSTRGSGVSRLDHDVFTTLTVADGLSSDAITTVYEDGSGSVWIGTQGGGLDRIAHGKISQFTTKQGLSSDVVDSLLEDGEGDLWVGTTGGGVMRLSDGLVTTYSTEHGLPKEMAWSVMEDRAGTLWVGTEGGGLSRFVAEAETHEGQLRLGAFRAYGTHEGLSNDTVLSMLQARDGALWIGTDGGGVDRFTPSDGKFVAYTTKDGLAGDVVRVIFEDAAGAIWIGSYAGGVTRIELPEGLADGGKPRFTKWTTDDGLPSDLVLSIRQQGKAMWIATSGGGLVRMEDGKFRAFRMADGLSSDHVKPLYVDGDTLWIGTLGGGLDRYRDGKFTAITTREGLFDDVLFAIVDDQLGHLWLTCNRGIFRVDKQEIDELARGARKTIGTRTFGVVDGMKSAECNGGSPGAFRAKDGDLWFPTMKGAITIDPREEGKRNAVPPPIVIEEIDVDRKAVSFASTGNDDLGVLSPSVKDFEFHYTGLSFRQPERVTFRYVMEGFDRELIDAGDRRVAYYTNLAPGAYRFRVFSRNGDGVWNDTGASVRFYVAPHFYQTWLFYGVCGLSAIALVFSGVRLRVAQLRARARVLESRVKERTAELAHANRALTEKDARIHEDLEQARAFQQRILPALPSAAGLGFGAAYAPAEIVGGDIYDVCVMTAADDGSRRVRVFLADATGHGVQASLRTMVLKTEYDRIKHDEETPESLLVELNRRIFSVYPGLEMRCSACCFDVVVEAAIGGGGGARVRYANAAHVPLLKISGDGPSAVVEEIYRRGAFIAMVEELEVDAMEVSLAPGDRLIAYTDGLCEQPNARGEEFGLERITRALQRRDVPLGRAIDEVVSEVKAFAGEGGLADDVTVIGVEIGVAIERA